MAGTGVAEAEISPELVLVDPELAQSVRPFGQRSGLVKPNVFPVSFPDNGRFRPSGAPSETLQRLVESASETEAPKLGESLPPHFGRAATLVPAISAATATMLLLVQLYLSGGSLS